MSLNDTLKRSYASTLLACLVAGLSLSSSPLIAQQVIDECRMSEQTHTQNILPVAIDQSWEGMSIDGAGGIDTLTRPGPGHFAVRPELLKSVEVINSRNGKFDTIVLNGEMILSGELDEMEVIADWYDQIILDPTLNWNQTVDAAFSSQIFRSSDLGRDVVIRAGLHDHVVHAPNLMIQTQEGPAGPFSMQSILEFFEQDSTRSRNPTLTWAQSGVVTPDFLNSPRSFQGATFDTRNRVPNVVVIDIFGLVGHAPRQFVFEGDAIDRLVLPKPECWEISQVGEDGHRTAVFQAGEPTEITIIADDYHLSVHRIGLYREGRADQPNYRLFSHDGGHVVDAIDLRNGGRDILIVRNDGRLRRGVPVVVEGDEGLDEIWLEGAAGWRIEFQDYGVVATVPADRDSDFTLAFAPGLKVGILPRPEYLNDPRLLALPAYPGLPDERTQHSVVRLTRGGFVNLSADQFANRAILDVTNGTANIVRLTPDHLVNAGTDVIIAGDALMDVVLSEGMPTPSVDPAGNVVWSIDRPDGRTQTVTAVGIDYIQYPTAN